jgi:hypothetical protein
MNNPLGGLKERLKLKMVKGNYDKNRKAKVPPG